LHPTATTPALFMDEHLLPKGQGSDFDAQKIAVIGAGWAGLQMMHCLQEKGFKVELFDKFDTVGGTWSPDLSYHTLTTHNPRWLNQMTSNGKFMPFKQNDYEFMASKADAAEMHQLMADFVHLNELMEDIHLNSSVQEIHYDSQSKKAYLMVCRAAERPMQMGPYDFVVFSSVAGIADLPPIPNWGFAGKVLHSSQFKQQVMNDIIKKNLRVAVIGGGKSGTDMMVALQKANHDNIAWIQRTSYWFFSYEAVFHRRTVMGMARSLLFMLVLLIHAISGKLAIFLGWLIGYYVMPCTTFPKHFNPKKFNLGCLDKMQLGHVKRVQPTFAEPAHFCKEGVAMKTGEVVACDIIICATGYKTGFDKFKFVKDGAAVDLTGLPLMHHTVVPSFPCLLVAPTACYHFGPIRAVTLAQYISYYARAPRLSEAEMKKIAERNWCSQSATTFWLFDGRCDSLKAWLRLLLDLVKGGILSVTEIIKVAFTVFCLNTYSAMALKVGQA